MTHDEKVARFLEEALRAGIGPWTAAPPLWRLLWRLGWKLPPPAFLGFWTIALLTGTAFAVLAGLLSRVLSGRDADPAAFALAWAGGGLVFGLLIAAIFKSRAGRLALPPWEHYPAD